MDWMTLVLFVAGLGLLVVGAEVLVRGASGLAILAGISPLVVGLTVVSFGTSAPELAVSVQAALAGQPDVALGNVVGSNIFNVLFTLGLCAIITPLVVHRQLVRLDVPLMIVASLVLFLMAFDGVISRLDGLILFLGIIGYTVFSIYQSRKEQAALNGEDVAASTGDSVAVAALINVGMVVGGLGLLVVGSDWLVNGAVAIAEAFGVSQLIIGLTIVAAGTSLPEVATSVVATIRGERDIAVGNVIGSNIFNILAIVGAAALINPIIVNPSAIVVDIPVMVVVALACIPIFFTGMKITRWEGALFFGGYVVYVLYLIQHAMA